MSVPVRRVQTRPSTATTTRVSNFLITLNTNWRRTSEARGTTILQDLERAAAQLFTAENVLRILKFRSQDPDFSLIDEIEWESDTEVSGARALLHMHIFVKITHRVPGRGIHLNIPEIRNIVRENGTTIAVRDLPYVNVHAFSSEAAVRAYIHKARMGRT